jgi:trehalose 6-phosphate synthase/phosphatase
MTGKANLEVRPTFINKGEIAKRLVAQYNSSASEGGAKVEFVLCLGDDFTDEDMFRALNGLSATDDGSAEINPDHCFTVTVGAGTKVTLARWHLLEPEDVIECVALLAGMGGPGEAASADPSKTLLSMSEVNLAALSAVEGHIPAGAN